MTFSSSLSRSEITLLNASISFTFVSFTESNCSRSVASSVSFSSNAFFAASAVEEVAVGRAEVVEEEEDARVRGLGAAVALDGTVRLMPFAEAAEVEVAGTRVETDLVAVEEVDKALPGRLEVAFPTVEGRVLATVEAAEEERGRRTEADVVPEGGGTEDFAVRMPPFEAIEEARLVERGAVGGNPPLTEPRTDWAGRGFEVSTTPPVGRFVEDAREARSGLVVELAAEGVLVEEDGLRAPFVAGFVEDEGRRTPAAVPRGLRDEGGGAEEEEEAVDCRREGFRSAWVERVAPAVTGARSFGCASVLSGEGEVGEGGWLEVVDETRGTGGARTACFDSSAVESP